MDLRIESLDEEFKNTGISTFDIAELKIRLAIQKLRPSWTLDVDGDGSVTALGDGLMIIRKLFRPAFAGDKLKDKAISNNAERDCEAIHDYIQVGIDEKILDVDGDGNITSLGDGLMIIRKLFGPAFAGDKLTDKAITNSASRNTQAIHEYIESLRP